MKNRVLFAAVAMMSIFAINGAAQTMSSTAELKLACETSPNNLVILTNNTQISTGPQAPLTETVNTKCTIEVAPQVTFEASQVSMTFAGPLRIQAGDQGRALFLESSFAAPSVTVALSNLGELLVERSLLRASTGAINVTSGVEGKVDVRGPLPGGGLVAARAVNISGGQKFLGSLTDAEVHAGTAVVINMTGDEGQFISTTSTIDSGSGAIRVTGSGQKSLAEFKLGSVATGRTGINVTLNGGESIINANEFNFSSPEASVIFRTGGNKSEIVASLGSISSGTATLIQSSLTGTEGKAIMQNTTVNAGGAIRIESGSRGNTEVTDSNLTANTLIRFATGAGGSCKSQNNLLTAPSLQICQ